MGLLKKTEIKGYKKLGVGKAVPMYNAIKGLQKMTGDLASSSQKAWKNVKR